MTLIVICFFGKISINFKRTATTDNNNRC